MKVYNPDAEPSVSVVSLFLSESSVSDLWILDVIEISDLDGNLTKKDLEYAALDQFRKTIKMNDEP